MPQLTTRLAVMIAAAVLFLLLALFAVRSCDQRRSEAAQARVERSQADAAANSAADAIGTVAASGRAAAESEDMTRANEREIRNAQGADARIGAGVNAAGLRALCLRHAYRNDPKCRMLRANP